MTEKRKKTNSGIRGDLLTDLSLRHLIELRVIH